MSERIALRLVLHPEQADANPRRHDAIDPDLAKRLKAAAVSDYSVRPGPETLRLFAILTRSDDHDMNALPKTDIVKRRWAFLGGHPGSRCARRPASRSSGADAPPASTTTARTEPSS